MFDRFGSRAMLLAAVLFAGPVLAGCIGGADAATAQQEHETAQDHAQQWATDATLVGVIGVEGNVFSQAMGQGMVDAACAGDYWERAEDDGDVGDGRSQFWVYIFDSDEEPGLHAVALDKDGDLVTECTNNRTDQMHPVGEWNIDSDEAVEAAMEASDGLREGASADYYGLAMILLDDGQYENAVWRIAGGGGDESGGGGGMVVIDAVTGEVLEAEGGYGSAGDWGSSWGG